MNSSISFLGIILLLTLPFARAYDIRVTYSSVVPGRVAFGSRGYCKEVDPASWTLMPTLESFNRKGLQALMNGGGEKAPLGGYASHPACFDSKCTWKYSEGIFLFNEVVFYRGVFYDGEVKVQSVPGFYYNWATGYPKAWENASYWGMRQPFMDAVSGWKNDNVNTPFEDWLCQTYVYAKSDSVYFPTFMNGDPIIPSFWETGSHCGHVLKMDSKNRYIDVLCEKSLPWWVGLLIATIGFIVLITLIISIWYCCLLCGKKKKNKQINNKLESVCDNQSNIPYQSQLGMTCATHGNIDPEGSFNRQDV